MSIRRPETRWSKQAAEPRGPGPDPYDANGDRAGHTGPLTDRPHSREAAEAQYVSARDAWVAAMRRANSGRPADLASLAIRQEAYEQATAEVQRWRSAPRVAIPIESDAKRSGIETAVGQELAWRDVHQERGTSEAKGVGRLVRRLFRRG